MNTEIVNIGFMGVGKHAEWSHMEQAAADPRATIAMLADIDPERMREVQMRHAPGAEVTTRWQDVIENPDINVVYSITPDRFHTPQLLAAVAAGKHAFVEKPLADTWDDYERLSETLQAAPSDLILSTCHPRRFDPPFINTKYLLDNRQALAEIFDLPPGTDFGPVEDFHLNLNYSRPSKTGLHTSFASDHIPHEIDTTSHFFGFSGLSYAVSQVNEELKFDIAAVREDGLRLRFRGNRLQDTKGYKEDWQIKFGERVTLSVDAHSGELSLTERGRLIRPPRRPKNAEGKPSFKTDYDKRFAMLNRHFIGSILNGELEPPYLSRQEMLMNTVVALALQDVDRPAAISAEGRVTRL